jgi:hypothetical protein
MASHVFPFKKIREIREKAGDRPSYRENHNPRGIRNRTPWVAHFNLLSSPVFPTGFVVVL